MLLTYNGLKLMTGFVSRFQKNFSALQRGEDLCMPVTPEELDMKKNGNCFLQKFFIEYDSAREDHKELLELTLLY